MMSAMEILLILNIAICMFCNAEDLDSLSSCSLTYTSWMPAERIQLKSNKLRRVEKVSLLIPN